MKYLSIDLGETRIGIAISDDTGTIAAPHSILLRKSDQEAISHIKTLCNSLNIDQLVLGIPLSARESTQKRFRNFGEKLSKETDIKVNEWDETFSTKQAQNVVAFSDGIPGKKKTKTHRDDVAAAVILQEYLDHEKNL
ncbi:Holliday junction resolvase RuvX [Candidatus Dojkabacteria bacterium]|nr:Holliday junction resolvase RuvX [Candidatus Dojkabacteria bacterium]